MNRLPVVAGALLAPALLISCSSDRTGVSTPAEAPAAATTVTAAPANEAPEIEPSQGQNPLAFEALAMPAPSDVRTAEGAPGAAYWQQQVDYSIDAALDAEARSLRGVATVVYHNNSPNALNCLWLNLEQNLFRTDSAGATLNSRGNRFGNRDGFEGGFQIESVAAGGHSARPGHPETAARPADPLTLRVFDTIGRVDLPEPIAPGGEYTFQIAWSFRIPPYASDRMGIKDNNRGDIFEMAQWFPNVCVYDDVHGWNTLPYLGAGEFYTNYGDYDVRLSVPREHIVAATGVLQNQEDVLTSAQRERLAGARRAEEPVLIRSMEEVGEKTSRPEGSGPLTWRFRAERVRTFAFASSASFIWDALGYRTPDGRDVLLQSVYPPSVNPVWRNSTRMLRRAIDHYSKKWAAYPYPSATNVHGVCGGMEYPMIVFCSAPENEEWLWGVTNHEIGHTWFPMLVNSDERRHAWMDEGFNTFINYYANLERNPNDLPARGNPRATARWMARLKTPIDTPADNLAPGLLGALEYGKTAAGLVLLRESVLGPERFDPAFREYVRRWSFKSPRPWDFFRTMEAESGMDLDWFFRGWFYGTDSLDQAIESVTIDGDIASVRFANLNGLVMPLVYEASFADGVKERRTVPVQAWAAGDRFTDRIELRGRALERIVIDPDEGYPDVNPENNAWKP